MREGLRLEGPPAPAHNADIKTPAITPIRADAGASPIEQALLDHAEQILELADAARDGARLNGPGAPEQVARLERASVRLAEAAALVDELRALFSRRVLTAAGEPSGSTLSVARPGVVRLEGPAGTFEIGFECTHAGSAPSEWFFSESGEAQLIVRPAGDGFRAKSP